MTRATARRAEWLKILDEIKHAQEIEAKKSKDDRIMENWSMTLLNTLDEDDYDQENELYN